MHEIWGYNANPKLPLRKTPGLVERGGKKFAVALKSLKENSQEEIAASGPKTRIN